VAYYYVKNGETAGTAGGTTVKSGAFSGLASTVTWGSIQSAIDDGGAGSGDSILCSDSHSFAPGVANISYTGPVPGTAATPPLNVISVSDADCDQYSAGAIEANTGAADHNIVGVINFIGVDVTCADRFSVNDSALLRFMDMTLTLVSDYFTITADGADVAFIDCTIDLLTSASDFIVNAGASLGFVGGKIYNSTGACDHVTDSGFTSGGGTLYFRGVDLSAVSGEIIQNAGGSQINDDRISLDISRCRMHASVMYSNESLTSENHQFRVSSSSDSVSAQEYQHHYSSMGGNVDDESGTYRDDSTAYPASAQKVSLKCVTSGYASINNPFAFDAPTRYAELSSVASDVVRIYLVSSTTLSDVDVWADAIYPDGTTKQLPNFVNSSGNTIPGSFVIDPFATGTPLTTNTEGWTNPPATPNYYQIDLDTSVDAGADCVPIIRVYVAKASATIYFCTSVDLV